jgi:RND family efflux transporter MFP subunit
MSNKAIGLSLSAVVAIFGCGRGAPADDPAGDRARAEPTVITVAAAIRRQEPVTLTLDGTLLADEESHVTSVVPGRVIEVLVERGDVVEAEAPLVRLRDVDYRLQAQAAQAQLEQARARLGMTDPGAQPPRAEDLPDVIAARSNAELAQTTLERSEELARRGVLSDQALDEARSRASAAREQHATALNNARASIASLASARTTLSQARTSAAEATVRAPFAGEIAERSVSVGEYVAPQTPLVTLVRTDPLRIELAVPQQHLMAVREGQVVRLTVDAVPDRTFEATVRYVSAAVRAETRSLVVEPVIPNADRVLRPGLFATARLETGGASEVAVVPPRAVLTQAGVDRVFVVRDGTVEERVVTVARRSNDEVVIASGLSGGENVATDKLDRLADGMTVRVGSEAAAAQSARRAEQ